MKKEFMIILALFIIGCNNSKKEVESYIRKYYPDVNDLEIIGVSKADSAYSPFWQLFSARSVLSNSNLRLSEKSMIPFREELKEEEKVDSIRIALSEYDSISGFIDSILFDAARHLDFPLISEREKNRLSVVAKFKINGKINSERFYFNRDENTIGHSDYVIKKDIIEIQEELRKGRVARRELERDLRNLEN